MKYELSRISGAVFKDLFEFGLRRGSQDASITTQDYEGFQKWRLMYNSHTIHQKLFKEKLGFKTKGYQESTQTIHFPLHKVSAFGHTLQMLRICFGQGNQISILTKSFQDLFGPSPTA